MSVSSTSPRTTTILTGTTPGNQASQATDSSDLHDNAPANGGSTGTSSEASPNRATSVTTPAASPTEATSSSGGKHKKTTPPKKPEDRSSPTMRSRSTSQPVLMIDPEKSRQSPGTVKSQPSARPLGSPPNSPRSPRRLQSFVGDVDKKAGKPGEKRTIDRAEKSGTVTDALSHTRPVLGAKSQGSQSELKPKQQAALDIADLIARHPLHADDTAEPGNFSVPVDALSPALKKIAGHHKDDKITIDKLISLLFGKTLQASEGWSNAYDMYVKFKINSNALNEQIQSGNERDMNEAKLIIQSYAASIAGAFFTLSRTDKLTRLPADLIAFLQQVDYRQLHKLLGDGKQAVDPRELDKLRRSRIADVLIDKCLAPQLADAFLANAQDNASLILRNQIKLALHAAFTETAASGLLADSLKSAPVAITTLFRQRRIKGLMDSSPARHERGEGHKRRGSTGEQMISPRSPRTDLAWKNRMERKEWLSKQLAWVTQAMLPVAMPAELLKAIKARNRAWLASAEPLQSDVILGEWQKLAARLLPDSQVAAELRKLLQDELEKTALIAEIQAAVSETALYSLSAEFGQGLHSPRRARPLSVDLSAENLIPSGGEILRKTTDPVTLTTTTSAASATITTTTTAATDSMQASATPRAARQSVPGLDLSRLSGDAGSPYKAPASSSATNVSQLPSGSMSLPVSMRSSPVDSPLASPINSPLNSPLSSPQHSPRSSPERRPSTRGVGEGELLNSARRKLNNRRQRASGNSSPRTPQQGSPRTETPRSLTPEQHIMVSGFAAALVAAMQRSVKPSAEDMTTTTTKSTAVTEKAMRQAADDSAVRLLTHSFIQQLGRFKVMIPVHAMPAALVEAMALQHGEQTIAHNLALKALVQQPLRDSKAGKALFQMKLAVMGIHKGYELKIRDWQAMSNAEDLKKMTMAEMKAHADATAHVSFGAIPSLARSGLPLVLLHAWREADAHLCAWAASNPQLSAEEVSHARSALGFDLLVTRSIYPLIYGAENEAELAVPGWFASMVREAHLAAWPAFFADFVRVVDAERAATSTISG